MITSPPTASCASTGTRGFRPPCSRSSRPRGPKSSTCGNKGPFPALALCLVLGLPLTALPGEYGGAPSPYVSGNIIADLFYQEKDSTLFCLTSSGLSYAKISPSRMQWDNFGSETFQQDYYFSSVAADDSTVFVTGYTYKGKDPGGGNVYYKSKGAAAFSRYYPSFRDNDTYYRLPYDVALGDSLAYISMGQGLMLTRSLPPLAPDWSALVFEKIDRKTLLAATKYLADSIAAYRDSLIKFRDTLTLSDTALFDRMKRLNSLDSAGDQTPAGPHFRMVTLSADSDSVMLKVAGFTLRSDTLVPDTLDTAGSLMDLAAMADTLKDSILPASLLALDAYLDTLRSRYDSLVTVIRPEDYPPQDYDPFRAAPFVSSIAVRDSLVFAGTTGGLLLASDRKQVFKGLLNVKTSPLCPSVGGPVPEVAEVALQPARGDTFRVWIITSGDTVAYSAAVHSTAVDSATLFPVHMDSLTTWRVLEAGYGVTDICFYRDTALISYGHRDGIIKFFQGDSVTPAAETLRIWKTDTIPIRDFLEPQLGINTVIAVPVDTVLGAYEIWAGTDDGLYRLKAGASSWEYYEYKRPMDKSHGKTYAYPTIIRPGYKSAKIAYGLSSRSRVTIEVFDFSMRKVRTVVKNAPRNAGDRSDLSQEDRWDGRDDSGRAVSPGVYYYKISAEKESLFGKFLVFGAKDYGERE